MSAPWTAQCGQCAVTAPTTISDDFTVVDAPLGWTSPAGTWRCDRCAPAPSASPDWRAIAVGATALLARHGLMAQDEADRIAADARREVTP